jgi:SPP1 family phage portal protein
MDRESANSLDASDIKKIIDANIPALKYDELQKIYEGDHKILHKAKRDPAQPDNRIVHNICKYVTNTAVGYFLGKPVIYSSNNDAFLAALQDIYNYNDEQDHNSELGKKESIGGNCFEMLYLDEDAKIRFTVVDARYLILIYQSGTTTPIAAIRVFFLQDKHGSTMKKVEYWTYTKCRHFRLFDNGQMDFVDDVEHYWQDIPFVEYINNEERIGDFEDIIGINDAYNLVRSNTANLFQYNDDAILKISALGDVKSKDVRQMKEDGAIILEDGGDISWLIKQINDIALENHEKHLCQDAHIYSMVPNLTDENFGQNLSGVAVSYKLWNLEQITATKERKFKKGLQRRVELIANILNIQGNAFDYRDIDMKFRRNMPQNLLEIAQIITMFGGKISQETALQLLPIIENVQEELKRIADEDAEALNRFGGTGGYDMLVKALNAATEEAPADEYN